MSPLAIGIIGIVIAILLMFFRMPIGFAFGIVGFFGIAYMKGFEPALSAVGTVPYATMTLYIWTVVPLFVFMGYIAQFTRIAEEFFDGVRRWVGHRPGGLASAVILGNTGFGAVSGDLISACVTFTSLSLPELRKYGYADSLTLGAVAGGSLLAILIPPSLGFIIYGGLTTISIGKLFIAGILPGLLFTLLYVLLVDFMCRRNPALGPPGPSTTFREKMGAGAGMWAIILVFVLIIGGIYMGFFTPTEAGAFGAFIVTAMGLIRRRLSWQGFKSALTETGLTWGMVAFLLIGVYVFNLFLVTTGLPFTLARVMTEVSQSAIGTLFAITVVYFVLGMFMDALAVVVLTVPILYPVILALGIDPVQFGVLVVIMMGVGAVSPPYGVVLFAINGVAKDVPIQTIFRGAWPFVAAMMVGAVIVILVPQFSTLLPGLMEGR